MKRNKMGLIILDDCKILDKKTEGRKRKAWIDLDGKEYLFKVSESNYELWAEVISSELAKQCGLETADYDIATYKGYIGVLTPNFLKKYDTFSTGDSLYNYYKEKHSDLEFDNSVDGALNIINFLTRDPNEIKKLRTDLIKIWLFDGLVFESDRNSSNWAIIGRGDNEKFEIAPVYDCSTMFMLNNDLNSLINSFRSESELNNYLDGVKYQFKRKSTDPDDNFLASFANFCKEETELAKEFIDNLDNVNYDKARKIIEDRINGVGEAKVEIPWVCNFWINKVLNSRINTLRETYKYISSKTSKSR